jgi:hypothetical protein
VHDAAQRSRYVVKRHIDRLRDLAALAAQRLLGQRRQLRFARAVE